MDRRFPGHRLSFPRFVDLFRRLSGELRAQGLEAPRVVWQLCQAESTFPMCGKPKQNPERSDDRLLHSRALRLPYTIERLDGERTMILADVTLMAFTACNSLRVLAYLPQIWSACTDTNGAKAISMSTWTLFLLSHATAAAYSVVNRADWALASMFLVNAAGCAAILSAAACRRYLCGRSGTNRAGGAEIVSLPLRLAA